jgi:hypothetical protein
MIYYNSKYLSEKLGINPAKWKRWAREFLPPDPLGGLQSGVARQFNVKDAFKVYLGGYLVSEMKFTIPDASQILSELSVWLQNNGFFSFNPRRDSKNCSPPYHIYIYGIGPQRFAYAIRSVAATESCDAHYHQQAFSQTLIGIDKDPLIAGTAKSGHLLAISALYCDFLDHIA